MPRGTTPVPPGVSVPTRTRRRASWALTASVNLSPMRRLPEVQISTSHSVSATIRRKSSSGMGMGPPVLWPMMSGSMAFTMSMPATWLTPDRETPPEWILTLMPRARDHLT